MKQHASILNICFLFCIKIQLHIGKRPYRKRHVLKIDRKCCSDSHPIKRIVLHIRLCEEKQMYCLIVVPLYVYCWFFQMLILRCIVLGSSRSPECVMVCILPASVPSHDVTFHIQQTLVEAFCVEHGIPILKVTAIKFWGERYL